LIAFATQAGFIGWERLTRAFKGRWMILFAAFVFAYVAIDLLSNRNPILVFIQYLTFSAHNAYIRVVIWTSGVAEVVRFPWLGLGLGDWARPSWLGPSVDNFWLLTAMRYGLPAMVMLVGAVIATMLLMCRKAMPDERSRHCRLAWCMTLISLTVVGLTVHFWNALFAWFFFLLGSGVWMTGLPNKQSVDNPSNRSSDRRGWKRWRR
ncbi:MAG: O-antigen ligase domain-containing protein, partial [Pseudomonadota bacterium]